MQPLIGEARMHSSRTIRKALLSVAPWVLATAVTPQGPVSAAPIPTLPPLLPQAAAPNALAVAAAIDAVFASGSAPADFVGLLNQPAEQLPDILERIAGQTESALALAGHESIRQFLALVLNPFAGTRPAQQPLLTGGTLWGAAYGSHMRLYGRPGKGFHTDITGGGGLAVGYDLSVIPGTVIGASFLYDYRTFEVAPVYGDGHDNGYNFAVYGTTAFDGLYLSAAGGYSIFSVTTGRDISFTGASGSYHENYTAHGYGGRVEAGIHLPFAPFDVTPFVAVLADMISMPAHTESTVSGSTTFAMQSPQHSFNRIRSELGIGLNNIPFQAGG